MYDIFKLILLASLMLVSSHISQIVGGFSWTFFNQLFRLPYIDSVYQFLLLGKVKAAILIKIVTWVIAMGGMYWGLLIYASIFGWTFGPYENWVIISVSGIIITNFINNK